MGEKVVIQYRWKDETMDVSAFLGLVCCVWPGEYDRERTRAALQQTINLTAWDGDRLVGCLRLLTDGYFFGTITELLVLPAYRHRGIGSRLLALARERTPTMLYFGAQPGAETFYENNGCQRGLPSYTIGQPLG